MEPVDLLRLQKQCRGDRMDRSICEEARASTQARRRTLKPPIDGERGSFTSPPLVGKASGPIEVVKVPRVRLGAEKVHVGNLKVGPVRRQRRNQSISSRSPMDW